MTEESRQQMKDACHSLAANILQTRARTNRCKWLRSKIAELLTDDLEINALAKQYDEEYPYADAPTEYLAGVLRAYDEEEK